MDDLESRILYFFSAITGVNTIILFGSYAKQQTKETSDVDIAILFDYEAIPSMSTLIEWRELLSEKISKEVDLVCLNTVSPILGMQVHNTGKVLQISSSIAYAKYQMRLFSEYAELKEIRAPMEADILKRKYYG